jgi:hypothetical protein
MREKECRKQKFDLSLGTKSLELESVFKEASRNSKCTFLFNNADKIVFNHLCMFRKFCFIYIGLLKNPSGDPVPVMIITIL